MNTAGWFVAGLLIFGVIFLFVLMLIDHNKIEKQTKLREDMEYTLCDMNIWMYYEQAFGAEFNPFNCNKIFIRIFESRDGYTKFEKQVFSQSYNKADKHEGTYIDAMSRENLYILLKAREAKLIVDCNKKA